MPNRDAKTKMRSSSKPDDIFLSKTQFATSTSITSYDELQWHAVITAALSSWRNNATRKRKTIACHLPFFSRNFEPAACWLHTKRKFAIFFLVRPLTEKVKREEFRRMLGNASKSRA